MALVIHCGEGEASEQPALHYLEAALGPEWAILADVPAFLAQREVDALLVGPRGMIVCELEHHRGALEARRTGAWLRDGRPIVEPGSKRAAKNFIEQAHRAAQGVKTGLQRFDPAVAKKVHVASCVLTTHPHSTLSFARAELRDHARPLIEAPQLVETLARRSRHRLSPGELARILAFAEQPVPPALAATWLAAARSSAQPRGTALEHGQARRRGIGPRLAAARWRTPAMLQLLLASALAASAAAAAWAFTR
jgi:hypothetical protein